MNLRTGMAAVVTMAALAAIIPGTAANATERPAALDSSISSFGRSFEGPYGVTAAYSQGDVVVAYSMDRYWVWNSTRGWYGQGLLSEAWKDAPAYNLNFSSFPDDRRAHRPYSYPGVSAAFFMNGDNELYLVSHTLDHGDIYWKYSFSAGWVGQPARLQTLLPNAPQVDGMFPFAVASPARGAPTTS